MKKLDLLMAVFTGVFGILLELTPIQIKFFIAGLVCPIVALSMNKKDYGTEKPSFGDYLTTILLSMTFVWFGYEAAIVWQIPMILALIVSFFLGIFSLALVIEVKKHTVKNVGILIKEIFDNIKTFINGFFKKN